MAKAAEVAIDATNFPDELFRNYVRDWFDTDENGKLSEEEIAGATSIDVSSRSIHSLNGIEYLTALTNLSCYTNSFTSLDLSKNTALEYLVCSGNHLTNLDLSKNTALTDLSCYINQLTSLDLSKNTALTNLSCGSNQLTSLDLSKNTALTFLRCEDNKLTELKLNSQTYDTLLLYKGYLHGINVSLTDLQNVTVTEKETGNGYTTYLIKVTDITKPATYKVKSKEFTIIYTDTVTLPPTPSTVPSTPPVPSTSPVVPSDVHIFSDYNYSNPVTNSEAIIYGNGKAQTVDGKKVSNKTFTAFTDITASYKHMPNSNGTVKSSVGKVIVGVTKSDTKPTVNDKNKITDISASKIAKAKIKNGQITVTAVGKEGGLVYLWVIDTGNKNVSAYCPNVI